MSRHRTHQMTTRSRSRTNDNDDDFLSDFENAGTDTPQFSLENALTLLHRHTVASLQIANNNFDFLLDNRRLLSSSSAFSMNETLLDVDVINVESSLPLVCNICKQSYMQHEPTAIQCGHIYCRNCIVRQLETPSPTCVVCRTSIAGTFLRRLYP